MALTLQAQGSPLGEPSFQTSLYYVQLRFGKTGTEGNLARFVLRVRRKYDLMPALFELGTDEETAV
jgi:hypothetical protein